MKLILILVIVLAAVSARRIKKKKSYDLSDTAQTEKDLYSNYLKLFTNLPEFRLDDKQEAIIDIDIPDKDNQKLTEDQIPVKVNWAKITKFYKDENPPSDMLKFFTIRYLDLFTTILNVFEEYTHDFFINMTNRTPVGSSASLTGQYSDFSTSIDVIYKDDKSKQ